MSAAVGQFIRYAAMQGVGSDGGYFDREDVSDHRWVAVEDDNLITQRAADELVAIPRFFDAAREVTGLTTARL